MLLIITGILLQIRNTRCAVQQNVERALAIAQEAAPRSEQAQMILFTTKFLLLHSMLEQTACGQQLEPKMAVACRRLCNELMATAKEFDLTESSCDDSGDKRACFGCPSGSFNFREWVNTIKRVYDYYIALITPQGFTPITPEEVAAGYTINSPGVYILMGPATYDGGGNAITINSPGVTLDLGGHRIAYTGTGGIAGIYANNQSNCTIQNGTVTNFDAGVGIEGGGKSWTVKNITCVGCTSGGILFTQVNLVHTKDSLSHGSPLGFLQDTATNNITEFCRAQSNGMGFAIDASGSELFVLRNNDAINNDVGVYMSYDNSYDLDNALVISCYATDNTSFGIFGDTTESPGNPSLVNNHAQGNGVANYAGFADPASGHYYETNNAFSWEFWECLSL